METAPAIVQDLNESFSGLRNSKPEKRKRQDEALFPALMDAAFRRRSEVHNASSSADVHGKDETDPRAAGRPGASGPAPVCSCPDLSEKSPADDDPPAETGCCHIRDAKNDVHEEKSEKSTDREASSRPSFPLADSSPDQGSAPDETGMKSAGDAEQERVLRLVSGIKVLKGKERKDAKPAPEQMGELDLKAADPKTASGLSQVSSRLKGEKVQDLSGHIPAGKTVADSAIGSQKNEKGLQKENGPAPGKGKKPGSFPRPSGITPDTPAGPNTEFRPLLLRALPPRVEMPDGETDGGGVPRLPATGGEAGLPSANSQSVDTTLVSLLQTKPSHSFRQSFQSSALSQMIARAAMKMRSGQNTIRIKLKPEILGQLRMHITTENHQVMIRITTEVPGVKEMIESHFSQLRHDLQNHGLQLHRFDVSVGSNLHQDRGTPPRFPYPEIGRGSGDEEEQSHERSPEPDKPAGIHATSMNTDQAIDYFA